MYHYIPDKSKNNVAAVLEVNPYFVRDYEMAARNYGVHKLYQIVAFLKDADLKSKGVGNSTSSMLGFFPSTIGTAKYTVIATRQKT